LPLSSLKDKLRPFVIGGIRREEKAFGYRREKRVIGFCLITIRLLSIFKAFAPENKVVLPLQ
jgi:hypothetical protein